MKTIVTTLNAKYIHMNLALRYLKAYAEPEFSVEMVEFTIKDPIENVVINLYQRNPDVIGFSCYIWNIEETIKVIQMLKKVKPNVKIVLGGPEVSYESTYWLQRLKEVDVIVRGEGEGTFKDLLFAFHNHEPIDQIQGIAYRKDGSIKINPPRPYLKLKDHPSPFRFKEDIDQFPNRTVYIETSRGCPFQCQFCLSSIEVGVRFFDREKIKNDLRYIMAKGAKNIKFVDRTFNISRKYAMDLFQFIIDEHTPGTVFQFEITADIMRPEVIDFLNKNAPPGLIRFEIGVQSTNEWTNELVKRKQDFEKLSRTVTLIKSGGKIVQHLDLIAGLPEEDYKSFRKTFNDVFALRPEELQLGFLKMLRGTGLRNDAKKWDYVYRDDAPYEILQNNVMTFDEIIRIKQVEDVLDKYWNQHRMDATIEYLVTQVFETPFDFFQQFGTFWESKGWSKIGHQLEDLFTRLAQFLQKDKKEHHPIALSLMKFDYLSRLKLKPRKIWWEDGTTKEERVTIYEQFRRWDLQEPFKNLTERDWMKKGYAIRTPFDLYYYLRTKNIIWKDHYILFYFDGKGNCEYVQINGGH
ncbi:B12-binding domain-containing radical SAM protein [Fervidibacillus halotolerans]|uniref:B12-binding domain-containing radical SAM protein n=1 Tax=Fervidibacillus halotolerans TaxID=2980027 RepID=A0A9E8M1F9_9BACI|nr:B12-binding domain-containing radical SAM protein [Fervidibacillus halotolerans]WAA13207.1 B12-binding domain-containing radical SAM protein [Fervidibacillus halotolerans]